ncbi:monovalent cation:proton antiporter family protein [Sulfurivirga sp.]|uniref:monovalent cation:proton antiporter family protein n=1 Tax=Sulfurivirga sp. TaxID=2614236 RepID=UPI0025FE2F3E|nr:monovalent cation:proton antiporter family protein [Sulfurivirga sp.]
MHSPIVQIAALLGISLLFVAFAQRLRLPPILAYIFVGMLLGPYGLGWVASESQIRFIAEVGIVFLLFSIGLEFSLPQMISMRRQVFGLGALQVAITTLVFFALATWALHLGHSVAFVIASALALSSTAIVIKQLADQGELHSRHGKAALGILIFQDLMAIPLLIIVPALGQSSGEDALAATLTTALLKGLGVVAILLLIGRYLLRPFFREVARSRSEELFTLAVLTVALSAAALAEGAGINMTLGAFVAGMMLGETEYRHQIESDIRPFRDVLLGLFFITVGMWLSPQFLGEHLGTLLSLALLIVVIKALVVLGIVWVMGKPPGVAVRSAMSLAQVGEFGLVLLTLAAGFNLIDTQLMQMVMTAAVLTMLLAPILIKYNGVVAKRLSQRYKTQQQQEEDALREETAHMKGHIILCGFGRVGQMAAHFLREVHEPYIALDMDISRVHHAKEAGEPVFYGNSARQTILQAAGIERARLVTITYGDDEMAIKTLQTVRHLRPDIPVLVRVRDDRHYEAFKAAGATDVISDTFEASLLLSAEVLLNLGHPENEVLAALEEARRKREDVLDGFYEGSTGYRRLKDQGIRKITLAVPLNADSYATNRRIEELGLDDFNVKVQAVKRGHIRGENPDKATRLRDEDVVVLVGEPENLERAEHYLQSGQD